jgi:uncharacterized cupredoxin-like copper-binding protein
MRHRSVIAAAALVAGAVAVPSYAVVDRSSATVAVSATEMSFRLTPKTAKRGAVTFRVRNVGDIPHDFKIAGKKSPLVLPGRTATLNVTFRRAGRYPYLCAVPGHAAAGMKGTLVVK